MLTRLALGLALVSVLPGCVAASDAGADLMPRASLVIPLPVQAPTSTCTAVAGGVSANDQVTLTQSFYEPFDSLDLGSHRWLPHYDGGYDPKTDTYLGAAWGLMKRTLAGNKEEEIYVEASFAGTGSRPLGLNPFLVHDGVLSIKADRIPEAMQPLLYNYAYYSGVLTSRASLVQRYGFFEMRARVPEGKALWPAFWLLAADRKWPPEIDVLEVVGSQPTRMVTTTHTVGSTGGDQPSGCRTYLADATRAFHNYGVLWTPQRIVYLIDRVPVAQMATPAAINVPMYMLLNLAVGGVMVGKADSTTPLPSSFDIDWVATYALPGYPPCAPRHTATEIDACPQS